MRVAWRASVEPILASGGTVILGLLCLLISDLASNRGLGPVAGIGIACALLSMLVLLPAVLVLIGRAAFWPFRPAYGSPPAEEKGVWGRVARLVGRSTTSRVWCVASRAWRRWPSSPACRRHRARRAPRSPRHHRRSSTGWPGST
jgi:putative drug exporter of the RND superfamily